METIEYKSKTLKFTLEYPKDQQLGAGDNTPIEGKNDPKTTGSNAVKLTIDDGLFSYEAHINTEWINSLTNPMLKAVFTTKPQLLLTAIKNQLKAFDDSGVIRSEKQITIQINVEI